MKRAPWTGLWGTTCTLYYLRSQASTMKETWHDHYRAVGVGAVTPDEAVEAAVLDVLNSHVQSARNGRCECGWRATFPDLRYPIGAEHFQHREHLAEEITKVLRG